LSQATTSPPEEEEAFSNWHQSVLDLPKGTVIDVGYLKHFKSTDDPIPVAFCADDKIQLENFIPAFLLQHGNKAYQLMDETCRRQISIHDYGGNDTSLLNLWGKTLVPPDQKYVTYIREVQSKKFQTYKDISFIRNHINSAKTYPSIFQR